MRLELTGRHVTIDPALRSAVERRLTRLSRKLNDGIISVQVVLTREKSRCHVEATLHARGDRFLHGEAIEQAPKAALDAALEKIEHQTQKLKGRWASRQRGSRAPAAPARRTVGTPGRRGEDGERPIRIVRARRYEVRPMSVDDAALVVDREPSAFVVFRNAATDAINVLFRRPDGNLGLIEPED
jgi:putative sigma-54 modulation protein